MHISDAFDDQSVDGQSAVRVHPHWIDVDFTDLGMGGRNLREDGAGERSDVYGRPAAPSAQRRRAGESAEHIEGGLGVHRRHFDSDIPIHLGLGAAGTNYYDRAEIRVPNAPTSISTVWGRASSSSTM